MQNLKEMTEKIVAFRDAREWKQFHNPKDLALSLVLESAEVLEHFQWKNIVEIEEYTKTHKDAIAAELVDTLYWVLLMSHDLDIDLSTAFEKKMRENDEKYPEDKAKGKHDKYTAYKNL